MSFSLPSRFNIFIGGRPVVNPETEHDDEEYFQAQAGGPHSGPPAAAVFEVQPGPEGLQLVSGEYVLGRHRIEDLSLGPKRVGWCKKPHSQMIQPVEVRPGNDGPELRFSGAKLAIIDNKLFTPLLDHEQGERVEIRPLME